MRIAMWRPLVAFVAVMLLAGCVQYTLVEPKRTEIGDAYTVDPQIPWSELKVGKQRLWTVDGHDLESLRFYVGLQNGDTLFDAVEDEELPQFDTGMRPSQVVEYVVDSFARRGANGIESSGLRPAEVGSLKGYRFELDFQTDAGLNVKGLAMGAIIEDRLHLIVFTAASTYYFEKYRDQVESMFASIQMI